MKRQLTANETLLVVEALKALMQDCRALQTMHKNVSNTGQMIKARTKEVEAQTLRNALLQKEYKLFIEGP